MQIVIVSKGSGTVADARPRRVRPWANSLLECMSRKGTGVLIFCRDASTAFFDDASWRAACGPIITWAREFWAAAEAGLAAAARMAAAPSPSLCPRNGPRRAGRYGISVIMLTCIGTLTEGFIQHKLHFTHILVPEEYCYR